MNHAFFALAAQSPTRQESFRRAVVLHLLLLAGAVWVASRQPQRQGNPFLGHVLIVAGIIEGAALVGWRLTQMPKSQALEFLLVSPLPPWRLFMGEALVGLAQLTLVTLSGLPLLLVLAADGRLDILDPVPLILMPLSWGALTGLGLTVWAYEPLLVRRIGERLVLAGILAYLVIGVLAGENLRAWLQALPSGVAGAIMNGFVALHTHNPFGVVQQWLQSPTEEAWPRALGLEGVALVLVIVCGLRAAARLQGHFRELHYQPIEDRRRGKRPNLGERPLTWWAVQRVSRYSGRINLWLAGGFGALYAVYLLVGDNWPGWMGRRIFELCDRGGGVATLTTALVVLSAVPAAFQYGLWDSNTQDRCHRLELLLLTRLGPRDYWTAAAAAAWRRGRGYFAVALLLWLAGVAGGRMALLQALAGVMAAALLWSLYFALGFRAFARGTQANGLGLLLSVGLPLATIIAAWAGWSAVAALLPAGMVYASQHSPSWAGLAGALLACGLALYTARHSLRHADAQLRQWYEAHHGRKLAG